MFKKNEFVELDIVDITNEGSGVGRTEDGFAVFVPMTAVGDRVRVKIVKPLKNYAYGIVDAIIIKSDTRTDTDCPVFRRCGGCMFRHISYEEELRIKHKWVRDNLKKLGGIDIEPMPVISSNCQNEYRNKAQYPVKRDKDGKVVIGFYARRTHDIIPCTACRLQPEVFENIIATVKQYIEKYNISVYDEKTHTGLVRHIYLRRAEISGEIMVCLVINGHDIPHKRQFLAMLTAVDKNIVSVVLNFNTVRTNVILGKKSLTIYGKDTISDTLCGVNVNLSPLSFYQVNRTAAEMLYNKAAEFAELSNNDILLDLYCGAGTIGLSMADRVKKLIGVEIIPQAIDNAKQNAADNGIKNAEFFCGDASDAAKMLLENGVRPNIVIVDPPRKGCAKDVLETIDSMSPDRIVMISCNSATMARDCAILESMGWEVKKVQPADLFPRTGHVETVCLLSREKLVKRYVHVDVTPDELGMRGKSKNVKHPTYPQIRE